MFGASFVPPPLSPLFLNKKKEMAFGAVDDTFVVLGTDYKQLNQDAMRQFLRDRCIEALPTDSESVLVAKLTRYMYSLFAEPFSKDKRLHNPVEQNTPERGFIRRGEHGSRLGGSEVDVVLGISDRAKPCDLYGKIIAEQDGTYVYDDVPKPACVHGNTCEEIIAEMFARNQGVSLQPGGYYRHPEESLGQFYGASPDRLVLSRGLKEDGAPEGEVCALLEIKAPYEGMYADIPKQYMAQMQYQMWVSGVTKCFFLAVKLRRDKPEEQSTGRGPRSTPPGETHVHLSLVHYSKEYMTWALPRLFYFSKCCAERTPPPRELYTSEEFGLEDPPAPTVQTYNIQRGAWRSLTQAQYEKKMSEQENAKVPLSTSTSAAAAAAAAAAATAPAPAEASSTAAFATD